MNEYDWIICTGVTELLSAVHAICLEAVLKTLRASL